MFLPLRQIIPQFSSPVRAARLVGALFLLAALSTSCAAAEPAAPMPDFDRPPLAVLGTGADLPGAGNSQPLALISHPAAAPVRGPGLLWQTELIVQPNHPYQLRADYAATAAAPPLARDYFDLYELDNRLLYRRENCASWNTATPFYLHIIPQDLADLPGEIRDYGIAHRDFTFDHRGGHFEGKCLASARLPVYPIKEIRTGQYVPGRDGPLWEVRLFAAVDPEQLRAEYAALAGLEPAARSAFDLYRRDNRLIYLRESCAVADTAAEFYLVIYPEDVTDLPEELWADGYRWLGFNFAGQGGYFDGKCLAAVTLPDYPIKEIRTGQFVPGQDNLWEVELITPVAPDKLRATYTALAGGEPIVRSDFDLYVADNRLIYRRESCAVADTDAEFYLVIFPEDAADLPEELQGDGSEWLSFSFARQGGYFDGKCLAAVELPDYPIKEIRAGQHISGQGPLWEVALIAPAAPEQLRAEYAALAGVAPIVRSDFDLYVADNRLIYLREFCAAADTAAEFFLVIFPEDAADLPEELRDSGHRWLGFNFARQGGYFDGKCLASVELPDYPIKEIRAGQHISGQGPLWEAALIAPADPDELRAEYAALAGVAPIARSDFDLYIADNRLIYLRESCAIADTAAEFYLVIFPEDAADLPEELQGDGSEWLSFNFARQGGPFDGKCLAAVELPDYPIKEIRAGQHISGQGPLWEAALIAPADPDKLRADYAALTGVEPTARDVFDLYLQDNRLLYLRESCAAADTAAEFFMIVFPEDVRDLPEELRADGYRWLSFNFARQGGYFDGKCLAAVALPDYPIKEIRAGQHIPGQGPLWVVELGGRP